MNGGRDTDGLSFSVLFPLSVCRDCCNDNTYSEIEIARRFLPCQHTPRDGEEGVFKWRAPWSSLQRRLAEGFSHLWSPSFRPWTHPQRMTFLCYLCSSRFFWPFRLCYFPAENIVQCFPPFIFPPFIISLPLIPVQSPVNFNLSSSNSWFSLIFSNMFLMFPLCPRPAHKSSLYTADHRRLGELQSVHYREKTDGIGSPSTRQSEVIPSEISRKLFPREIIF